MSRIDEIKKMLKTDKEDSFLTYALALEYEKIGQVKDAISIIETLIKTDPNYLGAYYKLGALYEGKNKMDKAMTIYRTGIKLANEKNDNKTKGELEEALWLIEEES
ncbi:tetratricopeptide repeat protein [Vicingaceae bacterium]|nr:tetratricopeptide repeat protein [Vicingaceae bacterium]MDA9782804.1 tetratricopeptide repeat protein [Vicingaceae bacterium]MDB4061868.1 tetratricopeptide repeat protein [Vicingaceae bacterium]MDB9963471.1 tetratricopeptide repeat protein [Vicingaceae bacterium]MDC1451654.1 tetratricopeptide repeat protein [Vicingaceae bacterium]